MSNVDIAATSFEVFVLGVTGLEESVVTSNKKIPQDNPSIAALKCLVGNSYVYCLLDW
jgi:hypothetical protein